MISEVCRQIKEAFQSVPLNAKNGHQYGAWTEAEHQAWTRNLGLRPVRLIPGDPVQIVEMRGCMGDVRGEIRKGVVQSIGKEKLYDGGYNDYWMAKIKFEDGAVQSYPAHANYWHYHEGIAEYYY